MNGVALVLPDVRPVDPGSELAMLFIQRSNAGPAQADPTIDGRVTAALDWAERQEPRAALEALGEWKARIELREAKIVSAEKERGATDKQIDRLFDRKKSSRGERARAKARAETLGRNDSLGAKVEAGELTPAHLDALGDADKKTGNQASSDQELLAKLQDTSADRARKETDRWAAEKARNEDLEARRAYQRRNRSVWKYFTNDGLRALTIAGDDESVNAIFDQLVADANCLYRIDGGREVPSGQHPRTGAQRLFDAAHSRLTGVASSTDAADDADDASDASDADDEANAANTKPVVPVVVVTAAKLAGTSAEPAELIGSGPIPDSLLADYLCRCDLVGMIFGAQGEVLWQGRRVRYPTRAQMLALVVRDRGCVLCDAAVGSCEAHHMLPYGAPVAGETDIDNLVLLCRSCHRRLHERQHTIYRTDTGVWDTRPATAWETPPARPANQREPDRHRRKPTH